VNHEPCRIEALRRLPQQNRRRSALDEKQRRRCYRVLCTGEEIAVRFLRLKVEGPDISGAEVGQARDAFAGPGAIGRG
jgi:hypothetical protein